MLGLSPIGALPLAQGAIITAPQLVLAATEAKDVASFTTSDFNLYLAATEAKDTAASTVFVFAVADLNVTEQSDIATFNVSNLNAALNATEATDTAVFSLSIRSTLSMAAVETPDGYSQKAYILWLTPDQPDDPSIWVPKNDPAPYLTTVI